MTMQRFVSRHKGAVQWAQLRLPDAEFVSDVDPSLVGRGDEVYGVIPLDLAAKLCERGARVFGLVFERRQGDRGKELTAIELEARGARFQEFIVTQPETLDR